MCLGPRTTNSSRIGNFLGDLASDPAFHAFCLMTTEQLQSEYQAMNRLANEGHDWPCVCGERGCSLCIGVTDVSSQTKT